jgi:hypothetical protein
MCFRIFMFLPKSTSKCWLEVHTVLQEGFGYSRQQNFLNCKVGNEENQKEMRGNTEFY